MIEMGGPTDRIKAARETPHDDDCPWERKPGTTNTDVARGVVSDDGETVQPPPVCRCSRALRIQIGAERDGHQAHAEHAPDSRHASVYVHLRAEEIVSQALRDQIDQLCAIEDAARAVVYDRDHAVDIFDSPQWYELRRLLIPSVLNQPDPDATEFTVLPCWRSKRHVFDGWGWLLDEYPDEGVNGPYNTEAEATTAATLACRPDPDPLGDDSGTVGHVDRATG